MQPFNFENSDISKVFREKIHKDMVPIFDKEKLNTLVKMSLSDKNCAIFQGIAFMQIGT